MKNRLIRGPATALAFAFSVLFTVVQVEGTPEDKNQADHAKQMQECMKSGKTHEQCMAEHKKMQECMEAGKSHEQCTPGMHHEHNHAY